MSYHRFHTSHLHSHRNRCQSGNCSRQKKKKLKKKNYNDVSYIIQLLTLGSLSNTAPGGGIVYCHFWSS